MSASGDSGYLIYAGMNTYFKAQVLTASAVLCVVIAVAADLLLLAVQRLLTPWTRGGPRIERPDRGLVLAQRPRALVRTTASGTASPSTSS